MRVSQMSRRRKIALAEKRQYLCGSNIRHPKQEIVLEQKRFGLIQDGDRAGHVSLRQPHAGQKHRIRREGVDAFYLPRQLEALLRVLVGSIQVVAFVINPGQA